MYNQFDINGLNQMQPMGYTQPQLQTMAQTPINVVKVNGENGAKAYQMPPNSSALLLDTTQPIVWLKTTDGACYPSITGYAITPLENKPESQPTVISEDKIGELESRISQLERKMKNGKSNSTNAK